MNAPATLRNAGAPREWHRYSLGQRLLRFALYLLLALAIGQAMRGVEIIPEFLYDAPEQMADLFRRMWPVDWAYYPAACTPRWSRPCTSPRWAPSCR